MYIPRAYRHENVDDLVAFMQAHSFISLVTVLDGAPFASHIPVALRRAGDEITISGHLAKANPQWRSFGAGEGLAIFSGPHAYIAPALYEKRESVPTWNYVAVHAYGSLQTFHVAEDRAAVEQSMRALIDTYDAAYQAQWDSLPEAYRDGMLQGIVGFELRVARLEGKYKLSQNRSAADRSAVAEALLQSGDPDARATGMAMRLALEEGEQG